MFCSNQFKTVKTKDSYYLYYKNTFLESFERLYQLKSYKKNLIKRFI